MRSWKLRWYTAWILALMSLLSSVPAWSYETELRAAAEKLISQLETAGQKSATVIDFTDLQGQGTELGRFLAQELSDKLVATAKTVSFVDRANLQYLLRENKLSMDGLINPQSSRKLGNMIGIDTIIFGTVTPIGKSVRLSVRAIAVESGRIVSSQSATLPVAGELADLSNRGIASDAGGSAISGTSTGRPAPAIGGHMRANSIKIAGIEIVVGPKAATYADQIHATMTFNILNQSGENLKIGLKSQGLALGPCVSSGMYPQLDRLAGLPVIGQPNSLYGETHEQWAKRITPYLAFLPAGGRITVNAGMNGYDCNASLFSGAKAAPITLTVVVVSENGLLEVPLSAEKVPIRVVGQ